MSLGVGVFDSRSVILERLQNFSAKPGIMGVAVADELQRQAPSFATPVKRMRTASQTVSPMPSKTAVARSFTRASIRVWTSAFDAMAVSFDDANVILLHDSYQTSHAAHSSSLANRETDGSTEAVSQIRSLHAGGEQRELDVATVIITLGRKEMKINRRS
jgi:hypothetical protein